MAGFGADQTAKWWSKWVNAVHKGIKTRREILEASGKKYHPPVYTCSIHCIQYDWRHYIHMEADLMQPSGIDRILVRDIEMSMVFHHYWNVSPKDFKLPRFIGLLDGPYGTGDTPNAATIHLLLGALRAYEPALVGIVVEMLFARFHIRGYSKMHDDPPQTRMVAQMTRMFPRTIPYRHRLGMVAAMMGYRRGDPARRTRVAQHILKHKPSLRI